MIEVLLDMEIMLIKTFNWNLYDLDRTDVSSLFDLMRRVGETEDEFEDTNKNRIFCDQAGL